MQSSSDPAQVEAVPAGLVPWSAPSLRELPFGATAGGADAQSTETSESYPASF